MIFTCPTCDIQFTVRKLPVFCCDTKHDEDSPAVREGELPPKQRQKKPQPSNTASSCVHRGDVLRREWCGPCNGNRTVFSCAVHTECSFGVLAGVKCCTGCTDKAVAIALPPVVRPPVPSVSRLAIVASFFNPHRGRRRVTIYSRFADAIRKQGLPLFCMEGMFNGSPQVDSTWQVTIDPEAIFWHKENLLNLAIERLPDQYDAIAWIDADVIYQNADIGDKIIDALTRDPIVQPWSQIRYLDPADKPIGPWRSSMSLYNSTKANPSADPSSSYPGMAWAASREVLAKVGGLYDRCITGGGDVAWASGVWGDTAPIYGKQWSTSLIDDALRWGVAVTAQTGGRCGIVTARAEHLYHGSIHDRQYVQRNAVFSKVDFDPNRDVEISANGTLKWHKHAPDVMRTAIAEYMHNRKEDD